MLSSAPISACVQAGQTLTRWNKLTDWSCLHGTKVVFLVSSKNVMVPSPSVLARSYCLAICEDTRVTIGQVD